MLRRRRDIGLSRALRVIGTLSRSDWAVLAAAASLLPAVAIALRFVPLRRLLALIEALTTLSQNPADPVGAARIARIVEAAASRSLPRPTCLAKAVMVLALLKRRGLAAELVIGVAKAGRRLEAHAWVRHGELVVVGGGVPPIYAPLVRLAGPGYLGGSPGGSEPAR